MISKSQMLGTKSAYEACFQKSRSIFDLCIYSHEIQKGREVTASELKECNKIRNIYEYDCIKMNAIVAAKSVSNGNDRRAENESTPSLSEVSKRI